jgi:anaerobic magnesium-protoporphyrin IX monomethyl ester cyclase
MPKINLVDFMLTDFEEEGSSLVSVAAGGRSHEPAGIIYLGGYLETKGHEIKIVSPTQSRPIITRERILEGNPRLIGFSSTTPDFPEIVEAAKAVKRTSNIPIVIGGYHVLTDLNDVISRDCFDYVIAGEGQLGFEDLIKSLTGEMNITDVRGRIYRNGKLVADNFERFDIDKTPRASRTPELMEGLSRNELFYPAASKNKFAMIQASAGCVYSCSFCQSNQMFPKGIRYRSVKSIITEMEECIEKFGTNSFLFTDSTFYGGNNNIQGIRELCAAIEKLGVSVYTMLRLDTDDAVFDALDGINGRLGVGVESFVDEGIKSGIKCSPQEYLTKVQRFAKKTNDMGMFSRGYFIMGRGESKEDILEESRCLAQSGLTDFRTAFLVPALTSVQKESLYDAGKIYTKRLQDFDGNHPIVQSPNLSADDLVELRKQSYLDFFRRPEYAMQVADHVQRFPYLEKSYMEFNKILKKSLGKGFTI